MCRTEMADEPGVEEEEEDDDDDNDVVSFSVGDEEDEDDDEDQEEVENHLLRGFRWLFSQHSHPSIFDGNSFAITRNSIRRETEVDLDSIDESAEEESELDWLENQERTMKINKLSTEMIDDLLMKRIPYEKLFRAYLCNRFEYREFQREERSIFKILNPKVCEMDEEVYKEDESRELHNVHDNVHDNVQMEL